MAANEYTTWASPDWNFVLDFPLDEFFFSVTDPVVCVAGDLDPVVMDQVSRSASAASRIFIITPVEGRDDWDEVKFAMKSFHFLIKNGRQRRRRGVCCRWLSSASCGPLSAEVAAILGGNTVSSDDH